MYCRTKDKLFYNYELGKKFSINSLRIKKRTDLKEKAINEMITARHEVITNCVLRHRGILIDNLYKEISNKNPNKQLFTLTKERNIGIIVKINNDTLERLKEAKKILENKHTFIRQDKYIKSNLETTDEIINRVLLIVNDKYREKGICKEIYYKKNQDLAIKNILKNVAMLTK